MGKWSEIAALFVSFLIILLGTTNYTTGFFLTRYEITNKSSPSPSQPPAQFSKIIILVIDALRFDFVYPSPDSFFYSNNLEIVQSLLKSHPNNTVLMDFMSDPPTVTMQRIKGMTTGSLPTFIDFKDNLHSDSIQEDNILYQMRLQNKTSFFVGDMIWLYLLPQGFTKAFPYDSHNVRDLDTVDNGVLKHFREELNEKWDLIIGHMLGVDHAGHRYHANHPEMQRKLREVNDFIAEIIGRIENDTLLVVMGDHGMTDDGNHGGDTTNERNTIVFAYSKKPFIYFPRKTGKISRKQVPQIDIVPTLSILLGTAIPYNNLGAVIPELFINASTVEASVFINVQQISSYLNTYDRYSKRLPDSVYETLQAQYLALEKQHKEGNFKAEEGIEYIQRASNMCRDIWTGFDLELMGKGAATVVICTTAVIIMTYLHVDLSNIAKNSCIALVLLGIEPVLSAGFWMFYICKNVVKWSMPQEVWVVFGILVLHGYSLFSDSYIVKEDQSLRFLLQGILAYTWSKKYSHELLACAVFVRLSGSVDLLAVTNEITKENYLYNMWFISIIPMLVMIYYSNFSGKINLILVLSYWHVEAMGIQLVPRIIYAWAIISAILNYSLRSFGNQRIYNWFSDGFYWNLIAILLLLNGSYSPIIMLCALCQLHFATKFIKNPQLLGTFIAFTGMQYFYATGHKCNIQSLIIPAAFIGFDEYNWYISGILLSLNTLGSFFVVLWAANVDNYRKVIRYVMLYYVVAFTCTLANTAVNRRQLNAWSIFAPKYIFDGPIFIVIWIVCLLFLVFKKETHKDIE